jgi:transposase
MAKTSKHVQPYSPEFRAEAIRLARTSGESHRQIADDLGMTSETLRLWLKQADLDAGTRHDELTSDEQEELRRLRREVRILREEREILKKPRPSSRGRPTRPGKGLCVGGAGEGPSSCVSDVSGARCLPERVLGVAAARAVSSRVRQRPAHQPHRADPPREPRHLWGLAGPGGTPGPRDAVRT